MKVLACTRCFHCHFGWSKCTNQRRLPSYSLLWASSYLPNSVSDCIYTWVTPCRYKFLEWASVKINYASSIYSVWMFWAAGQGLLACPWEAVEEVPTLVCVMWLWVLCSNGVCHTETPLVSTVCNLYQVFLQALATGAISVLPNPHSSSMGNVFRKYRPNTLCGFSSIVTSLYRTKCLLLPFVCDAPPGVGAAGGNSVAFPTPCLQPVGRSSVTHQVGPVELCCLWNQKDITSSVDLRTSSCTEQPS